MKLSFSGDYINMMLKQLGATDIKHFDSKMNIVNFDLGDGLMVSYVYNVTRKNKYFLQRMRPYALNEGFYATESEIIEFIRKDIAKFRNVKDKKSFNTFLLISHLGHHVSAHIEELFLNYEVPEEQMKKIEKELEDSLYDIIEMFHKCERIELEESETTEESNKAK
ncbi:MAG: hypothetical protein UHS41_00455 [Lachnospiraceae bacterium]|nr:hypothetical protein [Lachnospiraceae bacterium]